MSFIFREGFWSDSAEPNLPIPVETEARWVGQDKFLIALAIVEQDPQAKAQAYRGISICRCCKKANGNATYEMSWGKAFEWHWPSGYRHYIAIHNLRPSLAFEEFILYVAEAIKKAKR